VRRSFAVHTPPTLNQNVFWNTFRAETSKNEFAFANNSLAEGTCGRPGHIVPLNVLNIPTEVADEVMMSQALHIESRAATLDGDFTHQTGLYQIPQIVISRSP